MTHGLNYRRIESLQNEFLKNLGKVLGSVSSMKSQGVAAAEGLHLAEAVLMHRPSSVDLVILPDDIPKHPEWPRLLALLNQEGLARGKQGQHELNVITVPDHVYRKFSRLEQSPGPLLVVKWRDSQAALDLTQDVVVLDGIQDPGNLGTILRTCAAAGVQQVACTDDCAWAWGDKALRAGMGAQWALNLLDAQAVEQALDSTPQGSRPEVRVTSLQAPSVDLYTSALKTPGIWVFGHEGQGVRPAWLNRANLRVNIPQNSHIESLNVAGSVAICLFEQMRQRRYT